MDKKKKIFLAVWVVVTTALFYIFQPASEQKPEAPTMEAPVVSNESPKKETEISEELPLKLKGRIDKVLSSIEGMWDPTGDKVKEVGVKMEALEKALEENKPELAEKILSEIEVIISEK